MVCLLLMSFVPVRRMSLSLSLSESESSICDFTVSIGPSFPRSAISKPSASYAGHIRKSALVTNKLKPLMLDGSPVPVEFLHLVSADMTCFASSAQGPRLRFSWRNCVERWAPEAISAFTLGLTCACLPGLQDH